VFVLVTENRLTSSTDVADPLSINDNDYLNSSSSHSELVLFRAAEHGETGTSISFEYSSRNRGYSLRSTTEIAQTWIEFEYSNVRWKYLSSSLDIEWSHRVKYLSLSQHNSMLNFVFVQFRCIRYLLKYGADPCLENNLGLTPWNNLSKLNEILELECLQLFVDLSQLLVK